LYMVRMVVEAEEDTYWRLRVILSAKNLGEPEMRRHWINW
jgi:hypothetical protein